MVSGRLEWEGRDPGSVPTQKPPHSHDPRILTLVFQVEASSRHTDVRIEVEIELVGGAVQEGGHRCSWEREAKVIQASLPDTSSYLAPLFLQLPGPPSVRSQTY